MTNAQEHMKYMVENIIRHNHFEHRRVQVKLKLFGLRVIITLIELARVGCSA